MLRKPRKPRRRVLPRSQRNIGLSPQAFAKLAEMQDELEEAEWFLERTSHSVLIEFLVWYWRTGGLASAAKFSPSTRLPGRPKVYAYREDPPSTLAVRPADIREELRKMKALDRTVPRRRL